MTYSNTKPDPGPSPKVDVNQIRNNFSSYATSFSQNHTALNNRNQGFHEGVIFEQQSTDPEVGETFDVLYTKSVTNSVSTQPQLFVRLPVFLPTNNDTVGYGNDPMQLTYNSVNTAGPEYQSFFAGGYVVYFGQTSDITIPITISPVPSNLLLAIASAHNMTTGSTPVPYRVATNILSSSTFKIDSTLNGSGPVVPYLFTWIAIGKQ